MRYIKGTLLTLLMIGTAFSFSGCSNEDKDNESNIIIKSETVKPRMSKDIEIEEDYEIVELVKKNNDLYIHVKAELEDSQKAFELGTAISDSIKVGNDKKLTSNKVKNIKVFFNGEKRDMLFEGTTAIKEVSQNWEVKGEKKDK